MKTISAEASRRGRTARREHRGLQLFSRPAQFRVDLGCRGARPLAHESGELVPGTKMYFKIDDAQKRADIIAFLEELK